MDHDLQLKKCIGSQRRWRLFIHRQLVEVPVAVLGICSDVLIFFI